MGVSLVKLSVAPRLRPFETPRMLGATAAEYLRSKAPKRDISASCGVQVHGYIYTQVQAWLPKGAKKWQLPINPRASGNFDELVA